LNYQLIAQGTPSELTNLGNYQSSFEEGSKGFLELQLGYPLISDTIVWLDDKLESLGVPEHKVESVGKFLRIHFTTKIAPLVLIAAAIAACIVIITIVIAWKLYKLSPAHVVLSILGVVAIIAAVIAVISIFGSLIAGKVRIGK